MAITLGFVFFVLAGLGVLTLIIGALTANPVLLTAALVLFVLAVAVPVVVWLVYRPGLRRLQAAEAVRREAAWRQWQVQQQALREQQAQLIAEEQARIAAERTMRGSRTTYGDPPRSADTHDGPIYYEILGLSVHADAGEIEQAYKREIRIHHPDRGGEQRRAQLINEAFETLRDPAKRARYDRDNGIR
jgi:DnaJ-domain-containing protein 1